PGFSYTTAFVPASVDPRSNSRANEGYSLTDLPHVCPLKPFGSSFNFAACADAAVTVSISITTQASVNRFIYSTGRLTLPLSISARRAVDDNRPVPSRWNGFPE